MSNDTLPDLSAWHPVSAGATIREGTRYAKKHPDGDDATMLAEVGIAQAEATLALAEQQQIANLIALSRETFAAHEACEALGTFATAKHGEQIGLRPDITAALGIEAGR